MKTNINRHLRRLKIRLKLGCEYALAFFSRHKNTATGKYETIRNAYQMKVSKYMADEKNATGFHADRSIATLEKPRMFSHIILIVAITFFIVAIIWANFAVLDEVTRGEGKVIPSSQIQVVQNLEGGIIGKIFIKTGDIVKKGQILMQIDDTRFSSSYNENQAKLISLKIAIARLEAQTSDKPFTIEKAIEKKYPIRVEQAKLLSQTKKNKLERMQRSYELALKELNLTKPLVKKGAASPVEVLQQERVVNDMHSNMMQEKSEALLELTNAKAELATLNETNTAAQDRLDRTTVRSPVKGIVKQIKINTIGGVVQPGDDLIEIVPLDDTLLIEAKVKPSDIGFIHPNQKAMVKISAYDFSIYGGLEATVEQISADTIKDENQSGKDEPYYLVRVRTNKNFLGSEKKPLNIIPGMHANIDILTGKKSVLDYLLKPIFKARQNALTER